MCKHCHGPVCSIRCFQCGLDGEYVCKGCFSPKSTSQSVDTNTAPPPPLTYHATVDTSLNTGVYAAASVPPTDSPPHLPAFDSPPTNPPNSVPRSIPALSNAKGVPPRIRKGSSGPTPTSHANTTS
eukprot:4756736-Ditylum_brightwellii.AAC.1